MILMNDLIFTILVFIAVGIGFAGMPIAVSWLLGISRNKIVPPKELQPPAVPDETPWMTQADLARLQGEPYESGMVSVGPWRKIGYEYVIYAILFLVFDMIFLTLFFSLGAWLVLPGRVTALLCGGIALGVASIYYALAPRKYIRL